MVANDSHISAGDALLKQMETEYPEVFSEPSYPIHGREVEHEINLKPGCEKPPVRRLYPMSSDELKELKT